MRGNTIRYLERSQIDEINWDQCILSSSNGTVYCTVKYMDVMASSQWCAMVMGDYDAVLPLPYKRKWGVLYIYCPAFTQQTGIVSKAKLDVLMEQEILDCIPQKFRYICINLNAKNHLTKNTVQRLNHILDLKASYAVLRNGYSRSARRNIEKAKRYNLRIVENLSPGEIMALHRARYNDKLGVSQQDYDKFLALMYWLQAQKMGSGFGVLGADRKLVAASFYICYKDRLTFIFNGNSSESLHTGATHLLKDYIIKKYAGSRLTLDFEGSNNPNFARFYKQYGAIPEPYRGLVMNRLPWPLRILKR